MTATTSTDLVNLTIDGVPVSVPVAGITLAGVW